MRLDIAVADFTLIDAIKCCLNRKGDAESKYRGFAVALCDK